LNNICQIKTKVLQYLKTKILKTEQGLNVVGMCIRSPYVNPQLCPWSGSNQRHLDGFDEKTPSTAAVEAILNDP
jgi:hypothetical protein